MHSTPSGREEGPSRIFREQALEHYAGGAASYPDALWAPRAWLRWSYRLVALFSVVGVAFIALAGFNEYAMGPCVVHRASPPGSGTPKLEILIALPAKDRASFHVGQRVRLEFAGSPYAHPMVELESVADGIVSATQARQLLGLDSSEAPSLSGPAVMAEAALPAGPIAEGERGVEWCDGLRGIAHAQLRRTTVLTMLVPWVRGPRGPGI